MFKRAFCGINTLHACVFIIYIWQLGSFRASTLWFIDLTVASCHIQYTFLSSLLFFFTRKWTKHENTRSAIFLGYENSCRRLLGAQSIDTEGASLKTSMRLIGILCLSFFFTAPHALLPRVTFLRIFKCCRWYEEFSSGEGHKFCQWFYSRSETKRALRKSSHAF